MSACQQKHPIHKTSPVKIYLKDKDGKQSRFVMDIYDWQEYQDFKGNCTGKDVTSQHIQQTGGYEPLVTVLVQQILEKGNKRNLVIDFGAHIGWYTLLAARKGYDVACVEGDTENLQLLIKNATYNKVEKKLIPNHSFIDEHSPVIELETKKEIELVKIDIKNSEAYAIDMCSKLLKSKKVKYLLVSAMQPGASQLVGAIESYGMTGYELPTDNHKYIKEYGKDPLKTLRSYMIPRFDNRNVRKHYLFVRSKKNDD